MVRLEKWEKTEFTLTVHGLEGRTVLSLAQPPTGALPGLTSLPASASGSCQPRQGGGVEDARRNNVKISVTPPMEYPSNPGMWNQLITGRALIQAVQTDQ